MACSPVDPLSYRSCAGAIAKSIAGDAFDSIARSFGQAAQKATGWLWTQLDAATAVRLGGAGFSTVLGIVAAIAGTVAVALFVIQVLQSLLRREPGGLARAVRGLLVAFLAAGAAVTVANLLLAATDSLCDGIVRTAVDTDPAGLGRLVLGSAATAALVSLVTGSGGAAGVLLLSLAILAAVVIVYLALVIRKVLIVVTAVFAPLAFAGSLADMTVAWTRRWLEFTLALIFSKLILVLIFVIGYFMLVKGAGHAGSGVTQEVTQVVSGVIVLALAGFAPWMALKVVHFTGDHAGQLHAMASSTAGGALAAGRMGQKAAPALRHANTMLSAGSGSDTSSDDTTQSADPGSRTAPARAADAPNGASSPAAADPDSPNGGGGPGGPGSAGGTAGPPPTPAPPGADAASGSGSPSGSASPSGAGSRSGAGPAPGGGPSSGGGAPSAAGSAPAAEAAGGSAAAAAV